MGRKKQIRIHAWCSLNHIYLWIGNHVCFFVKKKKTFKMSNMCYIFSSVFLLTKSF